MKPLRLFAILLVMALVLPLVVSIGQTGGAEAFCSGGTFYVDASRPNDSGDGLSWATAKKNIQSAVDIACENATVYVAAGLYDQPADSDEWEVVHLDKTLNLIGAGARTTIIDGVDQYRGISITSEPGQVNYVSGFTIRHGRGPNYNESMLQNRLWQGAGIGFSPPYVKRQLFNGSRDMPDGGGIFITDLHVVTIEDCAIIDSHGQRGGGIYTAGLLTMNRCTVSGNDSYASDFDGGGGICGTNYTDSYLNLTNCTISGNTASGDHAVGGGIFCGSTARLLNVTIANNSMTGIQSGGGGFANEGSFYFKNCIVANNIATYAPFNNGYDTPGSAGIFSLGNNIDSENSCHFNQPTDQVNTDPQLGPLQDNGGPTFTRAITTSSPAYLHGDRSAAPDTDQRGTPRPASAASIGAFEPATVTGAVNTDSGRVTFRISDGYLAGLTGFQGGSLPCTAGNFSFPYGMFSFRITNLTPGQTVRVTIHLPVPLPPNASYFKCENGVAVDYTDLMSRPDDNTIILTITDGGRGDFDRTANGTVVDPGGPAVMRRDAVTHGASLPAVSQGPVALPRISVRTASLSAARVAPGTPVTVTADVANAGAVNGTIRVTTYVNGLEEQGKGVTVSSGSSVPVSFTVTRNEPGTYSVYVGGVQAGSFIVEDLAGSNLILILSGCLVALAIVIGLVYFVRRRSPAAL